MSLAAHGAGSIMRDDNGRVIVQVTASGRTSARVDGLREAGAAIVDVAPRYDTITAAVAPADLRDLAAAPGVLSVQEVLQPMTGTVEHGGAGDTGAINTCATGVVSEGNTQLKAGAARTQFDVDGTGVKVGILSDSYDTKPTATTHAAGDVATADLPGAGNPCGRTQPVQVLDDSAACNPPPCGDEGRAMLQIVHDLAPGASLAFATAFVSDTSFANNIRALANNGAQIIADDIIYFNEPMFQDGIIANAVRDVTNQGVTYFSMAFNNNIRSGSNDIGSFEAPSFRQSAVACPAGLPAYVNQCMDFNPSGATDDNTYGISIPNGATVRLDLQWNQPLNGVTTDYDMYLLGTGLGTAPKSENTNLTTQRPFEFLAYQNTSGATQAVNLVIDRYTGAGGGDSLAPRLKFIFSQNGTQTIVPTEYTTSSAGDIVGPSIMGHNGTATAQTVAAIPFNDNTTPEAFSSRGPLTHYYAPVSGTTPAALLSTPEVLNKPDITATDRGITTFFGSGNRFSGTSAATPHAAAVGALQLSANPALTLDQIKTAQKATAVPIGAFGQFAVGSGLLNAQAAIASQPPAPPSVSLTGGPTGATTNNNPTFTFTVGAHPKTINCSIDGGVAQACAAGSYAPGPQQDGQHMVAVAATDFFGQTTTATQSFSVDTTGPVAPTISKGPKKKTKSKKATFTFSGEAGGSFQCALDKAALSACTSPAQVRVKKAKRKPKKHTFSIQETDALGNVGATATYKWTVVKKKKKKHHH